MRSELVIGVLVALATGIAISVQSALSSRTGGMITPLRTGLLTNFVGGSLAGLIVLFFLVKQGLPAWQVPISARWMLIVSGSLGIGIITGVAFAFQRTGITAGLAALIMGQLFLSVIVDATGWTGQAPIPVNTQRILGLLVMGAAIYLLLPRH